jgi:Spy/CpxP family protein refolding chaperone
MARIYAWAFAALLMIPAAGSAAECARGQNPAARSGAQAQASHANDGRGDDHQPRKFWVDPALRAELGITDQQSSTIEALWKKDLQLRTDARTRLEKLETQLDQMMLDAALDENAFMAQLEKVEAARTEANKARMLLLYRINKVLYPDQRAKLAEKAKAMRDGRGDHR